jgi:3-hydroxybutyryl-CoA dehydrogenase
MNYISIIGSGTMGNGIAHIFALFGNSVHVIDVSEDALQHGLNTISKNPDRQVAKKVYF